MARIGNDFKSQSISIFRAALSSDEHVLLYKLLALIDICVGVFNKSWEKYVLVY